MAIEPRFTAGDSPASLETMPTGASAAQGARYQPAGLGTRSTASFSRSRLPAAYHGHRPTPHACLGSSSPIAAIQREPTVLSPSWIDIANILVRDRERQRGDMVPPPCTSSNPLAISWSVLAMIRRCASLLRPRKGSGTISSSVLLTEKPTHGGPDASQLRCQEGPTASHHP